jgi:hypothetical protein
MPFALVRCYVRALPPPPCPLGVLFSAGGSNTASGFLMNSATAFATHSSIVVAGCRSVCFSLSQAAVCAAVCRPSTRRLFSPGRFFRLHHRRRSPRFIGFRPSVVTFLSVRAPASTRLVSITLENAPGSDLLVHPVLYLQRCLTPLERYHFLSHRLAK